MACLDMYNSEQHNNNHHHCAPSMSPRISFSNDFIDLQQAIKQQQQDQRSTTTRSEASSSSDFEFSVTDYSMMSADELFFKGKFLPYKDNHNQMKQQRATTTLREELLVDDDENEGFSLRPPKGSSSSSTRWKGLLGLRKSSHIGGNSKKAEKSGVSSSSDWRGEARRRSALANEGAAPFKMITSQFFGEMMQERLNEGGSSCSDKDSGI